MTEAVTAAPTLSACVVAWNGGERLLNLLEALRRDRDAGLDLEAIVVDNASSDGSPERVAAEHPWARLVQNAANTGYARAANQAATLARGRLVLVLNDDVVPPPGALAALVGALDADPRAVAAGPRLVGPSIGPSVAGEPGREHMSASGLPDLRGLLHRITLLRWTGAFRAAHDAWRRPPSASSSSGSSSSPAPGGHVPSLCGAALLVRREALLRQPFDAGYPFGLEDADLCARLGREAPLLFVPAVTLVHLGGVASARNLTFAYRGFELGYARFLRLHGGRGQAALYKALVTLDQPARALAATLELIGRLLAGRWTRARESARRLAAILRFTATGLPALWWA